MRHGIMSFIYFCLVCLLSNSRAFPGDYATGFVNDDKREPVFRYERFLSQYNFCFHHGTEPDYREFSVIENSSSRYKQLNSEYFSSYDRRQNAKNYLSQSWSDIKYIYSSPARINWKSGLITAGLIGTGIVIYANDQVIYDAFQRNKKLEWFKPVDEATNIIQYAGLQEYLIPAGIVFHFVGRTLDYEPLSDLTFDMLEMFLVMAPSRIILVTTAGRERPLVGEGPYQYGFGQATSFFSGHSSTAFAFAGVLSHHVNNLPLTIFIHGVAAGVGVQRIKDRRHWPSDVFVGAIVGSVMTRAVLNRKESSRLNIYPSVDLENEVAFLQITYRL